MANSYIIYPADGVQIDWTVALAGGFLSRDDVFVQVITDGVPASQSFTWLSDTLIRITPAVASGKEVKIYRDTPKVVPLVDFSDGSIINEQNLDSSARQTLLAVAELADQTAEIALAAESVVVAVATAESALAAAEDALIEAEAAVAAVDGANTAASLATAAASAATVAANSATIAANTATATAANAVTIATAAEATANGIAATANSALTAANSAVTTANSAQATATSAEATADGIAATADAALTNANTAVTTANSAVTTAASATTTANAAIAAAANPVEKIGESATASQNFTITAEAANGTMKLARGNPGATTQDILTVNSGGIVKMPQNLIAFKVHLAANQGIGGATYTKMALSVEDFDTAGAWATSTYRFQPTVAGYYQFGGNFLSIALNTSTIIIYKNGAEYLRGVQAASISGVSVSGLIYLNGSTDYVELWAWMASGGTISGAQEFTYFTGHLIGAA